MKGLVKIQESTQLRNEVGIKHFDIKMDIWPLCGPTKIQEEIGIKHLMMDINDSNVLRNFL